MASAIRNLVGERDTLIGARRLANSTRSDRPIIIEECGKPVPRKGKFLK